MIFTRHMKRHISSIARVITLLGVCLGAPLSALEVNNTDNAVFDLYFFGNGETGMFGTATGNQWIDAAKQTSGTVADSATYYWTDEMKQAMLNAVNTWTAAIATEYDTNKHARKLRIGFFLDDASTPGGVMTTSMAGYATTQTVTTNFESEYSTKVNIYSVAEWAWRDNNETANYMPDGIMEGAYWESNILPDGENCIDIAIVLNPVVTSSGFDANGQFYYNKSARPIEELQNVATHELGHGMGVDSRMYTQRYDENGNSVASLSGFISTWDSLITLNDEYVIFSENGEIVATYATLAELQAAGWECAGGKDPLLSSSYTGSEIQYDPDRKLSLDGELGIHIAATMLEGDTLEHLAYGDGTNVFGPGGRENGTFSENDLRALEMLGWSVNYAGSAIPTALIPEPTTGVLTLLGLAGLALRRRRK